MKTENDVKQFVETNKLLSPVDRYWKWMADNNAVRIRIIHDAPQVFVIPDKKDALESVDDKMTFTTYQFYRDLWDKFASSLAKQEYKSKLAEESRLKQLDELAQQKTINPNEFNEVKKEMNDKFDDLVQDALDNF